MTRTCARPPPARRPVRCLVHQRPLPRRLPWRYASWATGRCTARRQAPRCSLRTARRTRTSLMARPGTCPTATREQSTRATWPTVRRAAYCFRPRHLLCRYRRHHHFPIRQPYAQTRATTPDMTIGPQEVPIHTPTMTEAECGLIRILLASKTTSAGTAGPVALRFTCAPTAPTAQIAARARRCRLHPRRLSRIRRLRRRSHPCSRAPRRANASTRAKERPRWRRRTTGATTRRGGHTTPPRRRTSRAAASSSRPSHHRRLARRPHHRHRPIRPPRQHLRPHHQALHRHRPLHRRLRRGPTCWASPASLEAVVSLAAAAAGSPGSPGSAESAPALTGSALLVSASARRTSLESLGGGCRPRLRRRRPAMRDFRPTIALTTLHRRPSANPI